MPGFDKGELIFSSTPYAHVLHDEYRGKNCDYCFKEKSDLKKCSQCSYLYFCDKDCQVKAWEMHKTDCKFIKATGTKKPDELTRLLALILLKIKKCGVNKPIEEVGDKKVSVASLNPHIKELKQDAEHTETMLGFHMVLKQYIGCHNVPPLDEFTIIYGKVCTSIFNITQKVAAVGCGFYLGATVFQHSCDPNAVMVYDGITANIRMRKSVPHRDLEKVSVSLLCDIMLTEERQKYLWENKYFCCECSLCTSPKSDETMTKLLNDTPKIKKKALQCKKDLEGLLLLRRQLDPHVRYDACMTLLNTQLGVYADKNIYKIKTLRMALDACLELKKWDEARTFASSLEEPMKFYFGVNHPNMTYFYFQFAQILYSLKRYREAAGKLSQALVMMEVTHGKGHPMMDELDSFLMTITSKMYKNKSVISVRKLRQQFENAAL